MIDLICKGCMEFRPIENRDLALCASCNKDRRDTDDEIWPKVRLMFLDWCVDHDIKSPIDGSPITIHSDIHHKMGRTGFADTWAFQQDITLHIDPRFFLAASRPDHRYIEDHRTWAIEKGYTLPRTGVLLA